MIIEYIVQQKIVNTPFTKPCSLVDTMEICKTDLQLEILSVSEAIVPEVQWTNAKYSLLITINLLVELSWADLIRVAS